MKKFGLQCKRTIDRRGNILITVDGHLHRIDGPAREDADGTKRWAINGKYHRVDGPAAINVYTDGNVARFWYQDGLMHRLDGPAIELSSGKPSWYIYGVEYKSEELFNAKVQELEHSSAQGKATS